MVVAGSVESYYSIYYALSSWILISLSSSLSMSQSPFTMATSLLRWCTLDVVVKLNAYLVKRSTDVIPVKELHSWGAPRLSFDLLLNEVS